MVFEFVFPKKKIAENFWIAGGMTIVYTIVGVVLGRLLFGANSGIAAVMFTSLMMIYVLKDMFEVQEEMENKVKKFSIKQFIKDNERPLKTYAAVFLGTFATYYFISFFGVIFGYNVLSILREQILLDSALVGNSIIDVGVFTGILSNNWWVLIACFLLSIVLGSGGVLFIIWNASAWATIFGYRAAASAFVLGVSPFQSAGIIQVITLPHTLIEGLAYIVAAVAGSVISVHVYRSKNKTLLFSGVFLGIMFLFWLTNFFLRSFFSGIILTFILIFIFLGLVWLMKNVFKEDNHIFTFKYNYYLLVAALLIFIIGVVVETLVLTNADILNKYYSAAYIYATLG